jgi:hypothetical protein
VSNFAEEREQDVPVMQFGEQLRVSTPHETIAAAILMYGFAVALVIAMGIALVWFARWAL